jgi:hypothetical protein
MARAPSAVEIAEENRRLRYLRVVVDLTAILIRQGGLGRREAEGLVAAARRHILELFPGKESTYDLIYRPRFERLIREFAREGEPAE